VDGQPSLDRLELVQTFAFYEPKGREAIWRGFYDDVRGRIGQQDRLNRRASDGMARAKMNRLYPLSLIWK